MPARWQVFHLHNALNALPDDHGAADLHLDEFDRHELAQVITRSWKTDKVPTVDEIRSRFNSIPGECLGRFIARAAATRRTGSAVKRRR